MARTLTYLVAPDSFKGSLSSRQAAAVIAGAISQSDPAASVQQLPLSDGGEGLIDALRPALGGDLRLARVAAASWVAGASEGTLLAEWLLFKHGREALLESACCLGLAMLPPEQRNPRCTSSRGLGELLVHAASCGIKRIWLGLGGSSTNDAGLGMAMALGFRFLPERHVLLDIADTMMEVERVIPSESMHKGGFPEVICLADVQAPLLGPKGASRTFARQKGAASGDVDALESAVQSFSAIVRRDVADIDSQLPGMGAAGGLGFGCAAFCRASLRSGIETVLDLLDFEQHCSRADVVITGEGCVDSQTRMGKVVSGVARRAAALGKPVVVLAGSVDGDVEAIAHELGVASIIRVSPEDLPEKERLERASELLHEAASAGAERWKSLYFQEK